MHEMARRELLHAGVCAAAACAGLSRTARGGPTSRQARPSPCPPGAWTKHGVVLQPTEPWEGDRIQNFTSPAEPLADDRWRLWYSACGSPKTFNIAYAEGTLSGPMTKVPARCTPGEPDDSILAIGRLPDEWKPTQPIHIRLNNGTHRLYFWVHGPGVLRYLAADSTDGRRYRVVDPNRPVLYHPTDRAACGVASPDGVLLCKQPDPDRPANEPPALARLISNDATTVYQLPDGTFELYSAALVPVAKDDPAYVSHDNAAGFVRVIDRYTSPDGLRFENRGRAIQRDPADPPDQQFYHLAVTHTPQGRVGMLGHYRVQAQTVDLEWCFSKDGVQWQRPRRSPWLPRGDESQPDSYAIYPPNQLVCHERRWHLFYTAVNSAHNGKHSHGPPRSVIMWATVDSIWA